MKKVFNKLSRLFKSENFVDCLVISLTLVGVAGFILASVPGLFAFGLSVFGGCMFAVVVCDLSILK